MIRRLLAVTAAMLCVAGLGVSSSTAVASDVGVAARQKDPHHGVYSGTDANGRQISFTFGGAPGQVRHFTIGHAAFGGGHVSAAAWRETCYQGICTKGEWTSDGDVSGAWRYGGSDTWTTWRASFTPPAHPHTGHYLGRDHRNVGIVFSFSNNTLMNFTLDHQVIGSMPVTERHFDSCFHTICIKGHWQATREVVGSWRYKNSHEWNAWDAFA